MRFGPSDIVDVNIILQRQNLAKLIEYIMTTYRYEIEYPRLVFV